MRILFVCTGNLCRSPVAERLAVTLAGASLHDSPGYDCLAIGSAGVSAVPGMAMDPRSAEALLALGGDPAGFRSRLFERSMADEADIVLTMTRQQRREILEKCPRGLRRTFTLLEAAALLGQAELSGLSVLPLAQRARELGLRLDSARAGRPAPLNDDVLDPIGRPSYFHADVAATVAAALRPLADALFTSVRSDYALRSQDDIRRPTASVA
jgi:protein-tyrosine phosphatase